MTARRVAWVMFAVSMVLVVTGPGALYLVDHDALVFSLAFCSIQIFSSVVGAVVSARLPENAVGWLVLGIGTLLGASTTLSAYGTLGTTTASGPLPADEIAAWVGSWTFAPVIFGGTLGLLYIFPDGRFLSVAWRRIAQVSAVILACATAIEALLPGRMDDASGIENPLGAHGWLADVVRIGQAITDPLALPVLGFAAAALIVRFRRSRGVERQQLKWISSALVLVGISLGLTASMPGFAGAITFFLGLFALAGVPLSIGAAMLRYRLYDIDVVINRALVYGSLTGALAVVYVGSVLLLQLVLTGLTEGSGLAVAGSTLAIAALFRPVRGRIQEAVDRRFFRSRYNTARTVEAFGARLRDEVDLAALSADLEAVVVLTMRPTHVSLWLRQEVSG